MMIEKIFQQKNYFSFSMKSLGVFLLILLFSAVLSCDSVCTTDIDNKVFTAESFICDSCFCSFYLPSNSTYKVVSYEKCSINYDQTTRLVTVDFDASSNGYSSQATIIWT